MDMVNVGILSMQRIHNYGSFLQAYGLKRLLEDLGCAVQFVDYHPGATLAPPDGGVGAMRKVRKAAQALQTPGPVGEKLRFIRYKRRFADNYFPILGLNGTMNYAPALDVLVIGSDEVFNCVQGNPNVGFCPELFGQGHSAKKLISYAASFGNTTEEKLRQYGVADKVAGWLQGFDALSVRDRNSAEIVGALTGQAPPIHLDPVLMYDFAREAAAPAEVPKAPYMLLYGYSGRFTRQECAAIRRFADGRGLKIYCIGGVQQCCDRFVDVDPFAVLAWFRGADCVVTDTFHGTIMSVITHRQFAAVVRESGYGNSQKLRDLLERLGLEDRALVGLGDLPGLLERAVDYGGTDAVILRERERTREYLSRWVIQRA